MRVGVGMMNVQGGRLAGVGRYAIEVVGAMARLAEASDFDCFVREGFAVPEEWAERDNLGFRPVRRLRIFHATAGWRPPVLGKDVWFAPAYDTLGSSPVRQVPMVHDLYPLTHPEWFADDVVHAMQRQIREAARVGRPVLANSEHTARDLHGVLGVPLERIRVIPLGPGNAIERRRPESVTDEELRNAGAPSGRFLLTVSTLEPRKNLRGLFEALAILRARPGCGDVSLLVAGGKGWKYEAALQRLDALGLGDAVRLLGYVDDGLLPVLFARCACYVCPSVMEGFGIPILEAMEAGCPVVTSDGGALPEVGADAVRYFDPLDPEAMADALEAALGEPERRAEWVRRGVDRAGLFTWQRTAQLTLEALTLKEQKSGSTRGNR